jgi:hypothetical protein
LKLTQSRMLGLFLALLGFSLMLKILFGIDFPVIRVTIALVFVVMGIRLASGATAGGLFSGRGHDAVAFGEAEYEILEETAGEHAFTIVCGRGSIDLSASSPLVTEDPEITVHVVCATCIIYYNPARPIRITAHTFVADCHLPDDGSTVMGTVHFRTPGYPPNARFLNLRVHAGLAKVTFVPKYPEPEKRKPSEA